MEIVNKDILSEIAKYLTSFDLKYLFFAFPSIINQKIYQAKLNQEEKLINILVEKTSVYMSIFRVLLSQPESNFCYSVSNKDNKWTLNLDLKFFKKIYLSLVKLGLYYPFEKYVSQHVIDDQEIMLENFGDLIKFIFSPEIFTLNKTSDKIIDNIHRLIELDLLEDIYPMHRKVLSNFSYYYQLYAFGDTELKINRSDIISVFLLMSKEEQELFVQDLAKIKDTRYRSKQLYNILSAILKCTLNK